MKNIFFIVFFTVSFLSCNDKQKENRQDIVNFFNSHDIHVSFLPYMKWAGLAYVTANRVELPRRILRYNKSQMWSTVFHEAAHIILYRQGKNKGSMDIVGYQDFIQIEKRTDRYAQKMFSKKFPKLKYRAYYLTANHAKLCNTYRTWLGKEEAKCPKE